MVYKVWRKGSRKKGYFSNACKPPALQHCFSTIIYYKKCVCVEADARHLEVRAYRRTRHQRRGEAAHQVHKLI